MVPAWRRYDGYLYDAARESLCKAVDKNLHVLILSGGYGILLVNEPIGNYRARLNLAWWPDGLLEETIVAYAKRHRLKRMRALVAATTSYSRLVRQVDWRATGVDDAVLLKPESIGGGAMVKVPRAQGEAFAALLDGELEYGWQSSDGIELRIERLG